MTLHSTPTSVRWPLFFTNLSIAICESLWLVLLFTLAATEVEFRMPTVILAFSHDQTMMFGSNCDQYCCGVLADCQSPHRGHPFLGDKPHACSRCQRRLDLV